MAGGARVDRIIEVEFGGNLAVSEAVLAPGGVIAAYGSMAEPTPQIPFYRLMFNNTTLRMMLVYLLTAQERASVINRLTSALEANALHHAIAARFALDETAKAHEAIESGALIGNAVILTD